jgi:hypothetical protein
MPALSPSIPSCDPLLPAPRERELPTCPICRDTMIAAEASVLEETGLSYLWNCETCGCGFVTRHKVTQYACV